MSNNKCGNTSSLSRSRNSLILLDHGSLQGSGMLPRDRTFLITRQLALLNSLPLPQCRSMSISEAKTSPRVSVRRGQSQSRKRAQWAPILMVGLWLSLKPKLINSSDLRRNAYVKSGATFKDVPSFCFNVSEIPSQSGRSLGKTGFRPIRLKTFKLAFPT